MVWIGLYFPALAIEVFSTSLPIAPALIVCDQHKVQQANLAAGALGVQAGMKRATAQALAPQSLFLERERSKEQQALWSIAVWLLQFTPSVSHPGGQAVSAQASADQAPGVVLEVEASLSLFGGLQTLLTRIRSGIIALGYSLQAAVAPTAYGAWLLAQYHDGAIAQSPAQLNARLSALPADALPGARPHEAVLKQIGVHKLKDLLQLPRPGMARRFGKALLLEMDQALGHQPQAFDWTQAPMQFAAKLELLAQVEYAQALGFAAQRLILQLSGWLHVQHAACTQFCLLIKHDDRPDTALHLSLSDASRDAQRMGALLNEKLQSLRLPAPALALQLSCDAVQPLAPQSTELFPGPTDKRESLGRLLERLQSRLGREHVRTLQLTHDHRPEVAYRMEPVHCVQQLVQAPGASQIEEPQAPYGPHLPRPLWLLPQPVALSERHHRPWWQGPLHLLAGPERIETGWWDGHLVQRDYFVAQDDGHVLYWIFRERLPKPDGQSGWFLQGRFG
jgi:protein ImuB